MALKSQLDPLAKTITNDGYLRVCDVCLGIRDRRNASAAVDLTRAARMTASKIGREAAGKLTRSWPIWSDCFWISFAVKRQAVESQVSAALDPNRQWVRR